MSGNATQRVELLVEEPISPNICSGTSVTLQVQTVGDRTKLFKLEVVRSELMRALGNGYCNIEAKLVQ